MERKCLAIAVTIGFTAIGLIDCSENNYITNHVPGDTVHIKGTVYAWRCGPHDWFNNHSDPEKSRFGVNTGESATVTFIRDNGFVTTVETDDSSNFELYLNAGSHRVVVETGYSFPPDTFPNVQLSPGNTLLPLDITYSVLDPLNMHFVFWYPTISDTASTLSEWNVIYGLNRQTYAYGREGYPAINLGDFASFAAKRQVYQGMFTRTVYTSYDLPINRFANGDRKLLNVVEVDFLLRNLIAQDTTGLIPEEFGAYPTGVYACLSSS